MHKQDQKREQGAGVSWEKLFFRPRILEATLLFGCGAASFFGKV